MIKNKLLIPLIKYDVNTDVRWKLKNVHMYVCFLFGTQVKKKIPMLFHTATASDLTGNPTDLFISHNRKSPLATADRETRASGNII